MRARWCAEQASEGQGPEEVLCQIQHDEPCFQDPAPQDGGKTLPCHLELLSLRPVAIEIPDLFSFIFMCDTEPPCKIQAGTKLGILLHLSFWIAGTADMLLLASDCFYILLIVSWASLQK